MRSKAHWGYDADFMTRSAAVLTVTLERIAAHPNLAAEVDGRLLGFSLLIAPDGDTAELDLFFVAPEAIGTGVGRVLFAATAELARAHGFRKIEIAADPHAEGFYSRQGAVRIGLADSDVEPGRQLPLLELTL